MGIRLPGEVAVLLKTQWQESKLEPAITYGNVSRSESV